MKSKKTKIAWAIVYDDDYSSEVTNSQDYVPFPYFDKVKDLNIRAFFSGSGNNILRKKDYNEWFESLHKQTIKYDKFTVKFNLITREGKRRIEPSYDDIAYRTYFGENHVENFDDWLLTLNQTWYRLMWFCKNNYYEIVEKTFAERMKGLKINTNNTEEGMGIIDVVFEGKYNVPYSAVAGFGRSALVAGTDYEFLWNLKYFRMLDEDLPDGAVSLGGGSYSGHKLLNEFVGAPVLFADAAALHEYTHAITYTNGLNWKGKGNSGLWWTEGIAELIGGGLYSLHPVEVSGFAGFDEERSTDPKDYRSDDGLVAVPDAFTNYGTYFSYYSALAFLNMQILEATDNSKNFGDFLIFIIEERVRKYEVELADYLALKKEFPDMFPDEDPENPQFMPRKSKSISDYNNVIDEEEMNVALQFFTKYSDIDSFKVDFQTIGVGDVFVAEIVKHYQETGDVGSIAGSLFGGSSISREDVVDNYRSTGYKPNFPSNIQNSSNELKRNRKILKSENINGLIYICHDFEASKESELLKLLNDNMYEEVYCIVVSRDGTCPVSIGPNETDGFKTSSKDPRLKLYCAEWAKINDAFLLLPKFISLSSEKNSSTRYNNLKITQTVKADLR